MDDARTHEVPTAVPKGAAVAMRGITKRFPGIVANDDVTFDVAPGEVLSLIHI